MRDSYRHFVAEFVGTFALVFVGGGAIMSADLAKNPAGITQIALAHGLILALMVTAIADCTMLAPEASVVIRMICAGPAHTSTVHNNAQPRLKRVSWASAPMPI